MEIAWSPSHLKRSSYFKIQSLNLRSENRFSDGRTRGGHARKRVAIGHAIAAETRHFRGNLESVGGVSVVELYWDSTSQISYKYPCRAIEKEQLSELKLRVSFKSSFLSEFSCIISFFLFGEEDY